MARIVADNPFCIPAIHGGQMCESDRGREQPRETDPARAPSLPRILPLRLRKRNVVSPQSATPRASMNTSYGIGDLSREFGVTTRTIRFYEDQGLLSPTRDGHSRIYEARDRVRLKLILRGKRLGFSLKEIKKLIELYDAPEGEGRQLRTFMEKIRARRAELLGQKADIEHVLDELDTLEQRCADLLAREHDGG
jgi:DNA-binding transcriptional MerR regulator